MARPTMTEQEIFESQNQRFGGKYIRDLQYEPYWDMIKYSPNSYWEILYPSVEKLVAKYSKHFSIPFNDMLSDAYIYFTEACKKYTPIYNGNFYPAKNYIMNYIYQYLRNYIYLRNAPANPIREQLILGFAGGDSDKKDESVGNLIEVETAVTEDHKIHEMELLRLINTLPPTISKVLKLTMEGKNQNEIASMLGLSQGRISNIFRELRYHVETRNNNSPNSKKKSLKTINEIANPIINLYDYCHDGNEVELVVTKRNRVNKTNDKRFKENQHKKKK